MNIVALTAGAFVLAAATLFYRLVLIAADADLRDRESYRRPHFVLRRGEVLVTDDYIEAVLTGDGTACREND